MAVLIDAIDIKRRNFFEMDNTPFVCLEAQISTPTARGGQTLVRLKVRNLLTQAVHDKTFKAGEKFKEPDLESISASYLYSDGDGSYFMDQGNFETLTLSKDMMGDSLDLLVEGTLVELRKFNGNPIGLELPCLWNSRWPKPNRACAVTPPAGAPPKKPSWRRDWRFLFRCSLNREKKVVESPPKRGNFPAALSRRLPVVNETGLARQRRKCTFCP